MKDMEKAEDMQNKYSENMILKVCYACGIVIIAVIAGDYGMPEECAKKYHINGKRGGRPFSL